MKKSTATSLRQDTLSPSESDALLATLELRFKRHTRRHKGIDWSNVRARLEASPGKLWSIREMERTGGEPDVTGRDSKSGEFLFVDCSAQSPNGRRSICYDREALDFRKEFKPENSAVDMAVAMGIELLSEEQYFELQNLGEFDTTTSSWLATPPDFRKQGGALFGDRRYGRVFIYQNSAHTYYRVRGFRGFLKV